MDRNLYAPPAAEVVDLEAPEYGRPKAVTWTIRLLWTWSAFELVTTLITQWNYFSRMNSSQLIYLLGLILGRIILVAWMANRLTRGRNWARILLAVLFVIALLFLPTEWRNHWTWIERARAGTESWYFSIFLACKTATGYVINLTWVGLLFTPQANSWFDTMSYYAGTGMDPTRFNKSPAA
jgi:hypothetical protein